VEIDPARGAVREFKNLYAVGKVRPSGGC